MNLIFLDIDGVLNSEEYALKCSAEENTRYTFESLDPACVRALNRLCTEGQAACVLSSVWRINWTLPGMQAHLEKFGFTGRVVDKTPLLRGRDGKDAERGFEIAAYLSNCQRHGPKVDAFVILDDDSDMGPLMPFLVKTEFKKGLTETHVDQALALLRRGNK